MVLKTQAFAEMTPLSINRARHGALPGFQALNKGQAGHRALTLGRRVTPPVPPDPGEAVGKNNKVEIRSQEFSASAPTDDRLASPGWPSGRFRDRPGRGQETFSH